MRQFEQQNSQKSLNFLDNFKDFQELTAFDKFELLRCI